METTTEFPLDIKCTLLFTKEDLEEYDKLGIELEAQVAEQQKLLVEIQVDQAENLDSEV